jgi:hypothetical protein
VKMFEILQLEMCRICLKTKDKDHHIQFIPIFEHFELNELVANLIIDCADIMVSHVKFKSQLLARLIFNISITGKN